MNTSPEDWMQQSRALINVRQHKQLAKPAPASINSRKQLSSFILFLSVVIFVNLCPFHSDLDLFNSGSYVSRHGQGARLDEAPLNLSEDASYLGVCMRFMRLMFTNPVDFSKRSLKVYQADARVIGKMAKMWYIKKKIKKLSKKLKKHTIAVPVFTAIPIYEHSYYPQPHVTHVSHAGLHHAAAASSYSPAVTSQQQASAVAAAASQQSQQLVASASNNHHQQIPYRTAPPLGHHHHHHSMYHPMPSASSGAHQIINSYAPSPPLYVDEAGGLYGHYGNAYGRYDGGYQLW